MGNKKRVKKLSLTNEDLKQTLAGVRSQLTKTENKLTRANEKADRWKKEAAAHRTAAARADARSERLQKKLDRATTALKPVRTAGLTIPDKTWTVVQLRAEAHARGLTGMSRKSKTQLLAALSRPSKQRTKG